MKDSLHSNKLRLLCDENLPNKLIELLIGKGFDVERAPQGAEDKDISKLANMKDRVMSRTIH